MLFRKFLIKIRYQYNTNGKRLFGVMGAVLLLSIIAGVLVDIYLPFITWGNIVRSIILIPTSISLFVIGYAFSIFLHNVQMRRNPEWTPYRARFSPMWRRRIALILLAVLLVLAYASGFGVGYTFMSSFVLTCGMALWAFVRTTRQENAQEDFGIPDDRDFAYNQKMRELAKERAAKQEKKRKEKAGETTEESAEND